MKKIILPVLLLSLFPLTGASQSGEQLRSRISRDSILIGDQIEWTIDFSIAPYKLGAAQQHLGDGLICEALSGGGRCG